jgi:hypothetical protein
VVNGPRQLEIHLPPRPTDDVLREKLADLVEQSNATTGEERATLHREIVRLRGILAAGRTT